MACCWNEECEFFDCIRTNNCVVFTHAEYCENMKTRNTVSSDEEVTNSTLENANFFVTVIHNYDYPCRYVFEERTDAIACADMFYDYLANHSSNIGTVLILVHDYSGNFEYAKTNRSVIMQ